MLERLSIVGPHPLMRYNFSFAILTSAVVLIFQKKIKTYVVIQHVTAQYLLIVRLYIKSFPSQP
jgi:hypothetical protein